VFESFYGFVYDIIAQVIVRRYKMMSQNSDFAKIEKS